MMSIVKRGDASPSERTTPKQKATRSKLAEPAPFPEPDGYQPVPWRMGLWFAVALGLLIAYGILGAH